MKTLSTVGAVRRFKAMQAAAAVGMLALAGAARAELPTAVGTAFNEVKADATSLNDLVLPIVISILGMFIVLKLIKRFAGKI